MSVRPARRGERFFSLRGRGLRRSLQAIAVTVLVGSVVAQMTTIAGATTTQLNASDFSLNTLLGAPWVLPEAGLGSSDPGSVSANTACLTADSSTSDTPIPGCSSTPIDSNHSGALRFSDNSDNKVGSTFYETSFPTSEGLDINFDTYQWDNSAYSSGTPLDGTMGADGIGFTMAMANPSNPQPPAESGPVGGSLGYSVDTSGDDYDTGLPYGYLGFGLDVFGNYENPQYADQAAADGGSYPAGSSDEQCTNSLSNSSDATLNNEDDSFAFTSGDRYPESVSVRGPGNGADGYCLLASSAATSSTEFDYYNLNLPTDDEDSNLPEDSGTPQWLDDPGATSRPSVPVKVEIIYNASASATSSPPSGWSDDIPAYGWGIQVTPITLGSDGTSTTPSAGSPFDIVGYLPSTCQYVDCAGSGTANPGYSAVLADIVSANSLSSWINSSTGIPYQVTLGWTASTGNKDEIHEINSFSADTYNAQTPTLSTTISDSDGSSFTANTTDVDFTNTPSVTSSTDEDQEIFLTDKFPTGITPVGEDTTGTDAASTDGSYWTCGSPSGQTITCDIPKVDAPSGGWTSSSSIPPLDIYADIASDATGTLTTDAIVSSVDALPYEAVDSGTVSSLAAVGSFTVAASGADGSLSTRSALDSNSDTSNTITLTASGLPDAATGTVTFKNGSSTTLCTTSAASSGTASCTVNAEASSPTPGPGTYSDVTGEFNGDSTYATGDSTNSASFEIYGITVSESGSPQLTANDSIDNDIELTASGFPSNANGTVTFKDGSTTLCSATVSGTSASCDANTSGNQLAAGTYTVTAYYTGDTHSNGDSKSTNTVSATSDSFQITVDGSTSKTVDTGTDVTLATSTLPSSATGSVSFYENGDGTPLCTTAAASSGSASCTFTESTAETVSAIDGVYNNNSDVGTGESTNTVSASFESSSLAVPSFTVSASPSSQSYGGNETISESGIPSDATGSVTFYQSGYSGTALCTATLPATSCTTSTAPAVGDYTTVGGYFNSGNTLAYLSGSSTNETSFDITAATTTTVSPSKTTVTGMTASATPATQVYSSKDAVQLTATKLPDAATGTVTFTEGSTTLCQATVSKGSATCTTTSVLPVGNYAVLATYSGDGTYAGATATTSFTVTSTEKMVAKADPSSANVGTAVKLTASDLPDTATGTVTFKTGSTKLCEGIVTSGKADCDTSTSLGAGDYAVTATYSGDTDNPSRTATTSFTLKEPSTTGPKVEIVSTGPGQPKTVTLTAPKTGGPFTFVVTSGPPAKDGSYTIGADGTLRFVPAPGYSGTATFEYEAKNGAGKVVETGTVDVAVAASSGGSVVPAAHTGEPWSGPLYWVLVAGAAGLGLPLLMEARSARAKFRRAV